MLITLLLFDIRLNIEKIYLTPSYQFCPKKIINLKTNDSSKSEYEMKNGNYFLFGTKKNDSEILISTKYQKK
jgi:hypothetical protein